MAAHEQFFKLWTKCRKLNERDEKMARKVVSVYSYEEVANMPRKHALDHPWNRGFRNHKRIKRLNT